MGRDGALYEIAQWYPRVAVYDDVTRLEPRAVHRRGRVLPRVRRLRRHADRAGRIHRRGDGRADEPGEVLTAAQRSRLALARRVGHARSRSSAPTKRASRQTRPATASPDSRDHRRGISRRTTCATSRLPPGPDFRWDASGYDGILIESLYRSKADKWPEVNRMAREAIKHYSEQWFRYPYSHATTVEGPVEGMEYPMLTFTPNSPTREDQQWVIAHEFGHQWFPMIVGSNERLYPWMDEGFNTFIDLDERGGVLREDAVWRHDRGASAAPVR